MHATCVDSNMIFFLGLGLLVKKRSGYGRDYRLLVIKRG